MKVFGSLESMQFELLAADPGNTPESRAYWNTVTKTLRLFDGTSWISVSQNSSTPAIGVRGSRGTPLVVTTSGYTPAGLAEELGFIKSSGGEVNVTSDPQIAPGTVVGQSLELIGCDDTDYVLFEASADLLINGDWSSELNAVLGLRWDGFNWCERYRR